MIPITVVRIGAAEERLVLEVLRSGGLAQGPMVARFEEAFAALVGVGHAVAVNNGTTSLVASLQALDLEPGDEVITSPFTFAATLNAILEAGATARFADIDERDFAVDPESVRALIGPRTRVLMPVHLFGQMADMGRIGPMARDHGLRVLEDAAQAHGAAQDGVAAGAFDIGSFSFYATKNITTGEGGMVTTDDADVAARLRILRNQGMRARYDYAMQGSNYRMTDLQAALALPQIDRYADTVARRNAHAARLSEGLQDIPGLVVPEVMPGRTHVWHQYTVRIEEGARVSRDEVVRRLGELGVGAGVYYPRPVFDYEAYRGRPDVVIGPTPVAARVAAQVLSLPVHEHLSTTEVDDVVVAVRRVLGAAA